MYTGSHLILILAILLIPSVFIFLIAADSENRNFNSDSESTVEKISLSPVDKDISLPTEDKILIKSGDTFYSTLTKFDVSPATINKIGQDRKLRDFISLQVNDQIYITSKNGLVFVKRFDDDFYLDVLTINGSNYTFEKNRDNLERIAQFREFVIKDSLYASGKKAGVPESVLGDLIYIFGWDIDYAYDIRNGDKVKILYEDIFLKWKIGLKWRYSCSRIYE